MVKILGSKTCSSFPQLNHWLLVVIDKHVLLVDQADGNPLHVELGAGVPELMKIKITLMKIKITLL